MMTDSPLVSVIIPTFNRAEFISSAVESVINQSFCDTEILVIDDGSTDDTKNVLQPYFSRIRYIYQDNKGVSAARNRGVQDSRGALLAFLDSDDVWTTDRLQTQVQLALSRDVCSFSSVDWFVDRDEDTHRLKEASSVRWPRCAATGLVEDPVLDVAEGRYLHLGTLLCNRSAFLEVGLFDEKLSMGEDEDWFSRASLAMRFHYIPKTLLRRRFHSNQIALEREESLRSLVMVLSNMMQRTERIHRRAYAVAKARLAKQWSHLANFLLAHGRVAEARHAALESLKLDPTSIRRITKVALLTLRSSILPSDVQH